MEDHITESGSHEECICPKDGVVVQDHISGPDSHQKCEPPSDYVNRTPSPSRSDGFDIDEMSTADVIACMEGNDRLICASMMTEGSLLLCQDIYWGAASKAIETGDVVVRLEIDPEFLYVCRPREHETFEVVSLAAVPSMVDLGEEMKEPMRSFLLV